MVFVDVDKTRRQKLSLKIFGWTLYNCKNVVDAKQEILSTVVSCVKYVHPPPLPSRASQS